MPVNVDLSISEAAKHISRSPHLLSLAKEALSKMNLRGKHIVTTQDMKRVVGYNFIIETSDTEGVFYAQLVKETVFTPLTKKGNPEPTNLLTMVLDFNDKDKSYILSNIWLGPFRPSRPNGDTEDEASKVYWKNHAYILGDQSIKSNTITKDCPY